MKGRTPRAGQLLIPAASAPSLPAGLISHLEREGGIQGRGASRGGLVSSLPPPLPIADFTPSQYVLSLLLSWGELRGRPSSDSGVLPKECLARIRFSPHGCHKELKLEFGSRLTGQNQG